MKSFGQFFTERVEKCFTSESARRLFIKCLPTSFLEKILEFTVAWPTDISVDCYLVTNNLELLDKHHPRALRPSNITSKRTHDRKQLILVDPDDAPELIESMTGDEGGVFDPAIEDGYPWKPNTRFDSLKWDVLIEDWLTEIGIPEIEGKNAVTIFLKGLRGISGKEDKFFDGLGKFNETKPDLENLGKHLGVLKGVGGDDDLHWNLPDDLLKKFNEDFGVLKKIVKKNYTGTKLTEVKKALKKTHDEFLDKNPLNAIDFWKDCVSVGDQWEVLDYKVLDELLRPKSSQPSKPKHNYEISIVSVKPVSPIEITEIKGPDGNLESVVLSRDPKEKASCELTVSTNTELEEKLDEEDDWKISSVCDGSKSKVSDKKTSVELEISPLDDKSSGVHKVVVVAGKSSGVSTRSTTVEFVEPTEKQPIIVTMDDAICQDLQEGVPADRKVADSSEERDGEYTANFTIKRPGTHTIKIYCKDEGKVLEGDFKGEGRTFTYEDRITPSSEIEVTIGDGKTYDVFVTFELEEPEEGDHESLTNWIADALSSGSSKLKGLVEKALNREEIDMGRIEDIDTPKTDLALYLEIKMQRHNGWKPILLHEGASLEELDDTKDDIITSKGLDLQNEPWKSEVRKGKGIKLPELDKYIDIRTQIIEKLQKQFTGPTATDDLSLVRYGFISELEEDLIVEYLDCWCDLIKRKDELERLELAINLLPDTVQIFRKGMKQPSNLLLGPFHPIVLSRLYQVQRCLLGRFNEGWMTGDGGALLKQQHMQVFCLDSAMQLENAFAIDGHDIHWCLFQLFERGEQHLPRDDYREYLLRLGLDVSFGPLGLEPHAFENAIKKYLKAYPARRKLRIGLQDNSPIKTIRDALVKLPKKKDISETLSGGLEIFDERKSSSELPLKKGTFDVNDEKTPLPFHWFHSKGSSLDISTTKQPNPPIGRDVEFHLAVSDNCPIVSGAITQNTGHKSFELAQNIYKRKTMNAGVEGALFRALITAQELPSKKGRALMWTLNLAVDTQWQISTASAMDPRVFIDFARSKGSAIWSYRLLGSGGRGSGHFILATIPELLKGTIDKLIRDWELDVGSDYVLGELTDAGLALGDEFIRTGRETKGAMGLYLCLRLLWGAGHDYPLQMFSEDGDKVNSASFLLQLDPFHSKFRELDMEWSKYNDLGEPTNKHADLISIHIEFDENGALQIHPVSIESKFRSGEFDDVRDIAKAKKQALNSARQIDRLLESCRHEHGIPERILLAEIIHLGLRICAGKFKGNVDEWSSFERKVLEGILGGTFENGACGSLVLAHVGTGSLDVSIKANTEASFVRIPLSEWKKEIDDDENNVVKETRKRIQEENILSSRLSEPLPESEVPAGSDENEVVPEFTETVEPEEIVAEPGEEIEPRRTEATPDAGPKEAMVRIEEHFTEFIGNDKLKESLRPTLVKTLISGDLSRLQCLLLGEASTGKTRMAHIIAEILCHPLVVLDGDAIKDRKGLVKNIDDKMALEGESRKPIKGKSGKDEYEYPPFVLFIDEVHLMSKKLQESLLTLFNPDSRFLDLGDCICHFPSAAFLAATTKLGLLDGPLKTRFGLPHRFKVYKEEDVSRIILFHRKSITNEQVRLRIAKLGLCIPRIALDIASRFIDSKEFSSLINSELNDFDVLVEVCNNNYLDKNGLGTMHWDILKCLKDRDNPIGEVRIGKLIGTSDDKELTGEALPLLDKRELIESSSQGYLITDKGKKYMEETDEPGEMSSGSLDSQPN